MEDLPDILEKEILLMTGGKILNLMDTKTCSELDCERAGDVEEENASDLAQDQIIQSQLLSGGLPMSMYAYFREERLSEIEQDASILHDSNSEIIEQIRIAKKV